MTMARVQKINATEAIVRETPEDTPVVLLNNATLNNITLVARDGGWKIEFIIPKTEGSKIPLLADQFQKTFLLRVVRRGRLSRVVDPDA